MESLRVAALCAAWYALSSASNVAGKLALSELPLPGSVAAAQLAGAALLSAAALRAGRVPPAPLPRRLLVRALLPLALAKLLSALCSQVSLWKVPLSYAHTVKATTPLWTALLSRVLFGERQSAAVRCSLVLIALGVGVASLTELQFDALGLGAALAAAALLSVQHLYSKRLLRDAALPPLRLQQTLSALALGGLLPGVLWREGAALARAGGRGAALVALQALLAWGAGAAALGVLARVSALAYGVASAAKRAAVVAASLLLLHNPASRANLAGMALAALGVLAYNRARARDALGAARYRPLLPV